MRQVTFIVNGKEYKTFDTWKILLAHIDFGFPSVKTNYVPIDGRDGDLDMTESLDGMPHYENRTVTISFLIKRVPYNGYVGLVSSIANVLHGKKCEIIFDADRGYKYIGRVSVDSYNRELVVGKFNIICDCQPFKELINTFNNDWMWDEFDFENGILEQTITHTIDNLNLSFIDNFEVIGQPIIPVMTAKTNGDDIRVRVTIKDTDTNRTVAADNFIITSEETQLEFDGDFKASGNLSIMVQYYPSSSTPIGSGTVDYTVKVNQGGAL